MYFGSIHTSFLKEPKIKSDIKAMHQKYIVKKSAVMIEDEQSKTKTIPEFRRPPMPKVSNNTMQTQRICVVEQQKEIQRRVVRQTSKCNFINCGLRIPIDKIEEHRYNVHFYCNTHSRLYIDRESLMRCDKIDRKGIDDENSIILRNLGSIYKIKIKNMEFNELIDDLDLALLNRGLHSLHKDNIFID